MARMLDDELLEELERRWRVGSPWIFGRIAPGSADHEIIAAVEPRGLTLPDEVMRWFRWQNGLEPYAVIAARTFCSIAEAVERSRGWDDIDERVPRTWLNVMDNRPDVFFDCGGDPAAPSPVWFYDIDRGFPRRPKFDSIGDMVLQWVELIDAGHLVWREDHDEWDLRDDASGELRELTSNAPLD